MKKQNMNLKIRLENYLKTIGVDIAKTPKINEYNDQGIPFILAHCTHYEYVIQEGNTEYRRDNYFSEDALIYSVMKDIVSSEASQYELDNRVDDQDFRILWFRRQVELMSQINIDWAKKLEKEYKQIIDF